MSILWVRLLLLLLAIAIGDSGSARADEPNILLITCDNLGYGDLATLQYQRLRTEIQRPRRSPSSSSSGVSG
jgi:hypothetical protein